MNLLDGIVYAGQMFQAIREEEELSFSSCFRNKIFVMTDIQCFRVDLFLYNYSDCDSRFFLFSFILF